MKNKHYQRMIASAKRCKKTTSNHGVRVIHEYPEPHRTLTYWDDFGFVIGSQRVMIWWRHPRMGLMDEVETLAHAKTDEQVVRNESNALLNKSKPIFKKRGKSRKKAVYYEYVPDPAFEPYYKRFKEIEAELYASDDVSVGLNFKIEQYDTGRGVEITYPVELRCEADVIWFANLVKQHMLGEINLFEGLEDYKYTCADYRVEHPKEESQ